MSNFETQAYHVDFALHTQGWKAFQELCAQVMEEEIQTTVSVYREAQDGGQDAVFLAKSPDGLHEEYRAGWVLKKYLERVLANYSAGSR